MWRKQDMEGGKWKVEEEGNKKYEESGHGHGEEMETKWKRLEVVPFLSLMNLPR